MERSKKCPYESLVMRCYKSDIAYVSVARANIGIENATGNKIFCKLFDFSRIDRI
jgi:hypothetical protein